MQGREYRYDELLAASQRVAAALQARGVRKGDVVACCVERGAATVLAILGILRCGAVLLPLDSSHPPARLQVMLKRSSCGWAVIASAQRAFFLEELGFAESAVVLLEGIEPADGRVAEHACMTPVLMPDDPAYIIFTSGSTGEPKGVVISHGALCRSVQDGTAVIRMSREDRCAQLAALTFDAAIWEHLAPLYCGGTLVPVPPDVLATPDGYLRYIAAQGISWTYLPPALFAAWIGYIEQAGAAAVEPLLAGLRTILFAGETLPAALVRRWQGWFRLRVTLMNFYGPTETTVLVCGHVIDTLIEDNAAAIPIGRAFGGNRLEILNERMERCGPGEVGTIFIGGAQLALGYLGDAARTTEAFPPDPSRPQERLYDSRDLAYRTVAGDVVFVGRRDNQVKIRGKRVELDEVESHLQRQPGVRQAAVLLHSEDHHKYLIAYVSGDALVPTALRGQLANSLPEYMLPHEVLVLPALPSNTNGKIDRAILAARYAEHHRSARIDGGTAAEDIVASIWHQVLGHAVTRDDVAFFAAGGDSLLMMRALMLAQSHGLVFDRLTDLLAHNTQEGWRRLLRLAAPQIGQPAAERFALTPMQQEMFTIINANAADSRLYHIQFVFAAAALDPALLATALRSVIRHHPMLRTVFPARDSGERFNQVLPPEAAENFVLNCIELPADNTQALEDWMHSDHAVPFIPDQFALLRATWIAAGQHRYFALTFFHPLLDGWSFSHLILQMCAAYRSLASGAPLHLPQPAVDFSTYSHWCTERAATQAAAAEREYWREVLRLPLPLVELAADGHLQGLDRRAFWEPVDEYIGRALKGLAGQLEITLHPVLLAAYFALFQRRTGQRALLIGNTIAGRPLQLADIDQVLGCFISIVPVRLENAALPFADLVRAVHLAMEHARQHESCPNETHVAALLPQMKSAGHHWRVIFALDNFPERFEIEELSWPPLSWNPIEPFEVALSVIDLRGRLYCYWNYRADRVSPSTARAISREYLDVLREVTDAN